MKKPLLIFDFFGVVIEEVAHSWLKVNVDDDLGHYIINELFVAVDEGRLRENDLFAKMEVLTNVPAQQIHDEWLIIGKPRAETIDFIRAHKEEYHMVLLSNAALSFLDKYFAMYPFDDLFSHLFVSSELNMAKPNPDIFRHVINSVPFDYSVAIMLDDTMPNIVSAKKVGIEAILFDNMANVIPKIHQIVNKY